MDRVFVDMEYIGKQDRQGGMDTVQSRHTLDDVKKILSILRQSELLVRCNPIHDPTAESPGSHAEIDGIIKAGADIVMLPYFKTVAEVRTFLKIVKGRCTAMLLLETPEAVAAVDEILDLPGVDEVLIGLNDLSLGYGKKFMFELLANGTVEMLCRKCAKRAIPYGFGGIASLGKGMLHSEYVIKEHYRLGSQCAILSRSFCDMNRMHDLGEVRERFTHGVAAIRAYEKHCQERPDTYEQNHQEVVRIVRKIVEKVEI